MISKKMFLVLCLAFPLLVANQVLSPNKELRLRSGDILRINTTTPEANHSKGALASGVPYNVTHKEEVATDISKTDWRYKYAEIVFNGNVVFEPGSIVKVTGKYGLSIKSITGDITIRTDIDMTCAVNATGMDMCLGGYAQNLRCAGLQYLEILPGGGPGCFTSKTCGAIYALYVSPKSSAGHGGRGAGHKNKPLQVSSPVTYFSWFYNRENITNLMGGSSGWYVGRYCSMPRSGGGAIELQADNGTITLSSKISANAQNVTGKTEAYGGSSGGRIRLKAQKVILQPNSSLEVDGSAGSLPEHFTIPKGQLLAAGGAGGVVQIIAASGIIEHQDAISMKPGNSIGTKKISEPGFLLIRDESGQWNNTWNSSWSFPNATYSWGDKKLNTGKYCQPFSFGMSPVIIPGQDPTTNEQIRDILLRCSCLKNKTDSSYHIADYFSGLVKDLYHVVTNQSLDRTQMDQIVDALNELKDIYTILTENPQMIAQIHWDSLFINVSRIVDNILDPDNRQAWTNSKVITMLYFMDEVSEIASRQELHVIPGSSVARLTYMGTNMAIQITKYKQGYFNGVTLSIDTNERTTGSPNYQHSVVLPREAIASQLTNTGDVSFIIKEYKDVEGLFPKHFSSSMRFDQITPRMSPLISVTILIDKKSINMLSAPVLITFVLQDPTTRQMTPHCVYWNKSLNSWKNDGLDSVSNGTHVRCSTNHLTSFAVLFSNTNSELPDHHVFALDLLTYICSGLSIAALFITLIIFYSIEALSSDRHRIHMHLALSILLSQVLFLAGIDATQNMIVCSIVAVFLHYFLLASFSWMCVEGVHLYMKIVRVYGTESIKMLYYYIFGWGLPVVYVGISASINSSGYGTEYACWLSLKNSFIWIFIGPVAIIVLVNIAVMVMVIKAVVTSADMLASQRAKIKSGVKGVFVLLPLLGVTWVFGLLVVYDSSVVFKYVFTLTNSLQGLFIFSFHCVGNNEVRTALKTFRERKFVSDFSPSNADAVDSVSRKSQKEKKFKEKIRKTKVYPLKKISSQTKETMS